MKHLFTAVFFISSVFLYIPQETKAIVDPLKVPNNKFGIHILYPEELELASELVNTAGGDWGYITIPIQSIDRNLEKWQTFMDKAKDLHLIPIIRIATYPVADYWPKPTLFDAVDFANFLNSLDWPTKNRYVILYNEPNRAQEWGGEVNPEEYASFLNDAIDIFKQRNEDFFLLNGGLDAAAPTNHILMDSFEFMRRMEIAVSGIFNKIDGWASHSYPNPDFRSTPLENRRNTIYGFKWEKEYLSYLGVKNLPVFITETGWRTDGINKEKIAQFYEDAFTSAWSDEKIVAVTPFLLTAGTGPFEKFSFTTPSGEPFEHFKKIASLAKKAGKPELTNKVVPATISSRKLPKIKQTEEKLPAWPPTYYDLWRQVLRWIFYK